MRRADAKTDSIEIAELTLAYTYKSKSLVECEQAVALSREITNDTRLQLDQANQRLNNATKEVKKQKFLKWVGFGLAAILTVKSLN